MDNKLLYIGGGLVAAYLLLHPPGAATPAVILPPGTAPAPAGTIPTTYGINAGYKAGDLPGEQAPVISNYAQLLAANPNLGNPNYTMTSAEANQYLANYLDIRQGMPTWPGGINAANLQKHWKLYGAPEGRIFMPLVPVSGAPYAAPQQNANASGSGGGSSWIGDAIKVVGTVAVALIGTNPDPQLNNAEVQLIMTGSAIIKDILPMFLQSNKPLVMAAQDRLDDIILQYS